MSIKDILEAIRYKALIIFLSYVLTALILSKENITVFNFFTTFFGAFFIFSAVYGYNFLTDWREDMITKKKTLLLFINRDIIIIYVVVAALTALYLSYLNGIYPFILAALILLMGFAYSHEKIRLKRIFVIKTLTIAIGWFLFFIYLNISFQSPHTITYFFIGLFLALLSFVGAMFQDVLDLKGDKALKLHSIPGVIGVRNTAFLALGITFFQYLILFGAMFLKLLIFSYLILTLLLPLRLLFAKTLFDSNRSLASFLSLISYPLTTLLVYIVEVLKWVP